MNAEKRKIENSDKNFYFYQKIGDSLLKKSMDEIITEYNIWRREQKLFPIEYYNPKKA